MIIIVYMFIIGAVLGSFYMVVGDRLSNNESIVVPRSHCSKCNHILSWYELIPIVSYIIQRGKCKNCHTKLSISYMLLCLHYLIVYMVLIMNFLWVLLLVLY